MIGFPLDSHVTFDTDGTPIYDRAITSDPYRKLLKTLFTNGILPDVSTNLQVTAKEGLTLSVLSGFAMVEGCMKWQEKDLAVTLDPGDSLPRIDRVVMRLDVNDDVRDCELAIIKGTPATSPVAPDLVRSSSVYDICLAAITVNSNTQEITNSNINDTRYDSNVCGVISSLSEFDTTTLYNQIQSDLREFKEINEQDFTNWTDYEKNLWQSWVSINEADFLAWYDRMKGQLSQDAAGNLQLQIDELAETAKKGSVVTVTTTDPTLFGKNVTISKTGFDPVTSSFNSAGVAYFETVPMVGDVSIEATNGTLTAHGSLNIPYFGRYSTTLEFWEAILNISTDIESLYNRQITVKKNNSTVGTTTFDSTGHATFSVHSVGTYNVSATDNLSKTYEVDVEVTEETTYTVEFMGDIDGATVEPTDDITTWLKCANIEDPSITTLADVLANRSLFETLIANSNACNYMARSTTWSGGNAGIVNSQDAMSLIGKYDYCSNALLSNATWSEAIANSGYSEEVLNVSVPKMTSNTAPSGEASASSVYDSNTYAYKAFDNDDSTVWHSVQNGFPAWVKYEFPSKVCVIKAKIKPFKSTVGAYCRDFVIQGSNDDSNWTNLYSGTNPNGSNADIVVNFANSNKYQYYRCYMPNSYTSYCALATLQFYGRSSAQTNIIHSAANDTIYMVKDGSPLVLTTTNSNGVGTLDFTQFDDGVTYKLYSSVAKDPNNLSNDYSKDIRITKSKYGCTTEAYLMPDAVKTLYWYGYLSKNCGDISSDNGWTPASGNSFVSPTFNTNNIVATSNSWTQFSGIGSIKSVSATKVSLICQGITANSDGAYAWVGGAKTKTIPQSDIVSQKVDSNALRTYSANLTYESYPFTNQQYSSNRIYALWYE